LVKRSEKGEKNHRRLSLNECKKKSETTPDGKVRISGSHHIVMFIRAYTRNPRRSSWSHSSLAEGNHKTITGTWGAKPIELEGSEEEKKEQKIQAGVERKWIPI